MTQPSSSPRITATETAASSASGPHADVIKSSVPSDLGQKPGPKPTHRRKSIVRKVLATVATWFDNNAGMSDAELANSPKANKVDWLRIAPFMAVHVACLLVLVTGVSYPALIVAGVLYVTRMHGITGWYHRYFSHKSFKAPRWVQFCGAVLGNSSAQRGPLWWAAHHRHHHRHSDEPSDAHSPKQHGFMWSHCLWFTAPKNFPTQSELIADLNKFPELLWLDRFDWVVPTVLGFSCWFLGEGLLVASGGDWSPMWTTNGPQMLVVGFLISTVAVMHCTFTINSLAHVWGIQRYKTTDTSRNSLLLSIITLGEGYHNNHHYYCNSARQGFFWWELDVSFYILWTMSKVGLVSDLKPVPKRVLMEAGKMFEAKESAPVISVPV